MNKFSPMRTVDVPIFWHFWKVMRCWWSKYWLFFLYNELCKLFINIVYNNYFSVTIKPKTVCPIWSKMAKLQEPTTANKTNHEFLKFKLTVTGCLSVEMLSPIVILPNLKSESLLTLVSDILLHKFQEQMCA